MVQGQPVLHSKSSSQLVSRPPRGAREVLEGAALQEWEQPRTKSGSFSLAGSHKGGWDWFVWPVCLDVMPPSDFPKGGQA